MNIYAFSNETYYNEKIENGKTPYIKIGQTINDIDSRIKQQKGSGVAEAHIKLLELYDVDITDHDIHGKLKDIGVNHLSGGGVEWFECCLQTVLDVISEMVGFKVYAVDGIYIPELKFEMKNGLLLYGNLKHTGRHNYLLYYKGLLYSGKVNNKYYKEGIICDGWIDKKFYYDGKKFSGIFNSGQLCNNGIVVNGFYEEKYYKEGIICDGLVDGILYDKGLLYNGYIDNTIYKDGKKSKFLTTIYNITNLLIMFMIYTSFLYVFSFVCGLSGIFLQADLHYKIQGFFLLITQPLILYLLIMLESKLSK